jgi:hypothetical protein
MKTAAELRAQWDGLMQGTRRRFVKPAPEPERKEPTEDERLRAELESWLAEAPAEKLIGWLLVEAERANGRAHVAPDERTSRYALGQESAFAAVAERLRILRG